MESFKENKIVKYIYGYIQVFSVLLIFALIGFFWFLYRLFSGDSLKGSTLSSAGLFRFRIPINYDNLPITFILLLLNIAVCIVFFLVFRKLLQFIINVKNENPFIEKNGYLLKNVGIMLLIIATLNTIVEFINNFIQQNHVIPQSIMQQLGIIIMVPIVTVFQPTFVLGLFIFLLGEIIIRGAKIKQENDLTV